MKDEIVLEKEKYDIEEINETKIRWQLIFECIRKSILLDLDTCGCLLSDMGANLSDGYLF